MRRAGPLLLALTAVLAPTSRAEDAATTSGLQPDASTTRTIRAEEAHRFELLQSHRGRAKLPRLAMEQDGIDVIVVAFDRDGVPLGEFNAPLERFDRESFLLPEETAEIEIRPLPGGMAAGSYTLTFGYLAAEEQDLRYLRAAIRMSEAARIPLDGPNEELSRAAELYEVAAADWESLGDRYQQTRARLSAAVFRRVMGDAERGHELYGSALGLSRELGERGFEAECLVGLGQTARRLGKFEAARTHLESAFVIWQELGRGPEAGTTLANLGLIAHIEDDFRAALELYQRALDEHRRAGKRLEEANLLLNVGSVQSQLGEASPGLESERRSLALFRQLGDRRGELDALNNLAVSHRRLGELEEALRLYHQVRELARELGDGAAEGRALNNQGRAFLALGELELAARHFERALPLRRATGDNVGETVTLLNLGDTSDRRGETEEARQFLEAALEMAESLGHRKRIDALGLLGRLLARQGEPGWAARFDAAHQLLEGREDPLAQAGLLLRQGESRLIAGDPAGAHTAIQRAYDTWSNVGDVTGQTLALTALGQVELSRDRLQGARRYLEQALSHIETLRSELTNPDLRATFLASRRAAHLALIDVLLRLDAKEPGAGHARAAFEISERSRARRLLDLLAEAELDLEDAIAPDLADRRRDLVRRLSLASRHQRLAALGRRKLMPGEDLAATIGDLEAELDLVEAEIRRRDPRRAALRAPPGITTAAVMARLDSSSTLLQYVLAEDRGHLFVLTADDLQTFTLPPRREVEAAARRFHELLASPSAAAREAERSVSRELSAMVLEPAAGALGGERLVIVADGALHYVPFAALPLPDPSDEARMIERFEIVHLPAASLLGSRQPGPSPPSYQVHVFADPVFELHDERFNENKPAVDAGSSDGARSVDDLSRLPGSRLEAEAITAGLRPEEYHLKLGFEVHRDALASLVPLHGRHSIVHFATHGIIDSEHAALSGLVLSLWSAAGERRADGFLRLHDIYGLELDAELVVLSGCRTGLGRELRGEGLVGLTSGFFYAGARRVMASLWSVADRATADLMGHFYAALLHEGLTPAAALRRAQLALAADRRYRDPYYWAAFVLQGDPR